MEHKEFHEKVLNRFVGNLTDRVFLMIQNDRELMQDYLNLLKDAGERKSFNGKLAQAIEKKFDLTPIDECENPESVLIKSYTRFQK